MFGCKANYVPFNKFIQKMFYDEYKKIWYQNPRFVFT